MKESRKIEMKGLAQKLEALSPKWLILDKVGRGYHKEDVGRQSWMCRTLQAIKCKQGSVVTRARTGSDKASRIIPMKKTVFQESRGRKSGTCLLLREWLFYWTLAPYNSSGVCHTLKSPKKKECLNSQLTLTLASSAFSPAQELNPHQEQLAQSLRDPE